MLLLLIYYSVSNNAQSCISGVFHIYIAIRHWRTEQSTLFLQFLWNFRESFTVNNKVTILLWLSEFFCRHSFRHTQQLLTPRKQVESTEPRPSTWTSPVHVYDYDSLSIDFYGCLLHILSRDNFYFFLTRSLFPLTRESSKKMRI